MITVSSEASADLSGENLLNEQPSEPWRTSGAGTHIASGGFGQARPCTVGVLWNHNLAASDTVTWELADDAAYSVNLVSNQYPGRYAMRASDGPAGGDADGIYQAPFVVGVISEVERAYWRWTIERSSGYTQVGRMMMGLGWKPGVNFDWGLDIRWVDPSIVHRSRGGQTRALLKPKYRVGSIRWSWLAKDGAEVFDDIVYRIGKGNTVLVIPYPDELTTSWGRRKTVLARVMDHSGPRRGKGAAPGDTNRYFASTEIEEIL